MRKIFTSFFLLIVLSLVACWPALLNGQPFFFWDTYGYLHNGNVALARQRVFCKRPSRAKYPSLAKRNGATR